jgi:uncharacterized protein (DUF1800 family)
VPASLAHLVPPIRRTARPQFSQAIIAGLLTLQATLPAQLLPQSQPTPQMAPPAHSTAPLTNDEKILQVLNRFTYGPRPGDVERVRAMGLSAWFNQQMNPSKIDDSALEARLVAFPAMQLPLEQMLAMYPTNAMIRANMNGRGPGIPSGEAEKAIYADQMAREKNNKKKGKDQAAANPDDTPLLSPETTAQIIDLPADKRFSALCKMKPQQLQQLRRSLTPEQREHLTDGFTPRQLEAFAAFSRPQAVVAAEATQSKLLRDIYTERQLQEVMVDFWLNHFNVYIKKSQQAPYYIASYERDAIRPIALGHFENLLVATATSPAMLNYLDNASSIGPHSVFANRPVRGDAKKRPNGLNENYARELMELHTLGVNGGYTQRDVTEVAKVFTGWTVGKRPFATEDIQPEFDASKHEPGPKFVLGTIIKDNGPKEGFAVLHMLATSPKTAHFISTKLAIRFVSDDPPPAMIERMARTFQSTNGDIRQVLLAMVNSPEFFSRDNYRTKVKTPQDFVVSAVRASGANVTSPGALVDVLSDLGMPLYGMQTPNGYSMKSDAWNNTAALIERMNFSLALSSNRVAGVTTDWPAILGNQQTTLPPEAKASVLEQTLLHTAVSDRTRQTILTQITTDADQQESSLRQVAIKDRRRDPLAVVPRNRKDGDLTGIDSQSALAAGLLFGSPEFQRR